MKITPAKLVLLAVLLPAIVVPVALLGGADGALTYDQAISQASRNFTHRLWEAQQSTDIKDDEGQQFFEDGIRAAESGVSFRTAYSQFNKGCREFTGANVAYCEAAGEAYSAGYHQVRR